MRNKLRFEKLNVVGLVIDNEDYRFVFHPLSLLNLTFDIISIACTVQTHFGGEGTCFPQQIGKLFGHNGFTEVKTLHLITGVVL